jgi:hypothetical protein
MIVTVTGIAMFVVGPFLMKIVRIADVMSIARDANEVLSEA